MFRSQEGKLRSSGINFGFESDLTRILSSEGIDVSVVNGVANIVDYK
jgi:hypothetical protein